MTVLNTEIPSMMQKGTKRVAEVFIYTLASIGQDGTAYHRTLPGPLQTCQASRKMSGNIPEGVVEDIIDTGEQHSSRWPT